jgi:glycosyltransferase involved in cell wall biosynthesis
MSKTPRFSIIIPVYNRPDELKELLESLAVQPYRDFEVLVIEDGSTRNAEEVAKAYTDELNLNYFKKPNTGQGFSRNYGFERAMGDYFLVFDSDCIIPPPFFTALNRGLTEHGWELWGGPDAAHDSFSPIQKAISYSMTSLFTTGGIRGKKKHAGVFHPRSFNLGLSRRVYDTIGGFIITRKGEDIEYSIRAIKAGFKVGLIPEAFVYHKRRTSFGAFWKQLHFFGTARININRFHPGEIKAVHTFPMLFTLGWLSIPILSLLWPAIGAYAAGMYALYFSLIALDASFKNRSLHIGLLSVVASFIQLSAYGFGFMQELFRGKSAVNQGNEGLRNQ